MRTTRNPFKPFTYWTAWPENHLRAQDFRTRREAEAFVRANGGGAIRKFRQDNPHSCTTRMDVIEVPAPRPRGVIGGMVPGDYSRAPEAF